MGNDVTGFAVGDAVLGWVDTRSSHAEFVAVPADQLLLKPDALDFERAGALFVAGGTAWSVVWAVNPAPGDTIFDFQAAARHGVRTEGSAEASNVADLDEIASRVTDGRLELTVAATYPLERVREAFAELEKRHTRGKIVLVP